MASVTTRNNKIASNNSYSKMRKKSTCDDKEVKRSQEHGSVITKVAESITRMVTVKDPKIMNYPKKNNASSTANLQALNRSGAASHIGGSS